MRNVFSGVMKIGMVLTIEPKVQNKVPKRAKSTHLR